MARTQIQILFHLLLSSTFFIYCICHERKVHIVYMGDKPKTNVFVASKHYSTHHSILENVLGSAAAAKDSLIYSYGRSFNGFAAKLSDQEVIRIADMDGVISVIPNTLLQLHTTRSWDFLGFSESHTKTSKGGNVIIAVLDSGIWPESESFSDEGFGPPPKKWKGICQSKENFTCNNKIIGGRYYNSMHYYNVTDIRSPRDSQGHGTHTASTAAGREVEGANYFGIAQGVARGGHPNARIAVYKVCWSYGCNSADIFAAFDDAIADGVDIISASIGMSSAQQYWEEPIAIGSFHAMKRGILTTVSGGNNGPLRGTVSNSAPWLLTVAATSMDRKFVSQLVLGNGKTFTGHIINNFNLEGASFPLIWGGDAANISANAMSLTSRDCFPGNLDSNKVKGKLVLCESRSDGSGIIMAGGIGAIMPSRTLAELAFPVALPSTLISREDIGIVLEYIRSSENPMATILASEVWKDTMAPYAAIFSSRGPNPISPDILKPDLSAPGINILAAWSPIASPSIYKKDKRRSKFYIDSGTSMACPHVSGSAAYVKAAYPHWSPAAIKSALMTTATIMDPKRNDEREFAYGSGLLNPVRALDPGLVFNASKTDYINFLCRQGYNTSTMTLITNDRSTCGGIKPGRGWDLNYPSFSLAIEDGQKIKGNFTRKVTNVGLPCSTYNASIDVPEILQVKVEPSVLSFTKIGEKKSFSVIVDGPPITQVPIISGSITWKDGVHEVRTPLVVYTVIPKVLSNNPFQEITTKSTTIESSIYPRNKIFFEH